MFGLPSVSIADVPEELLITPRLDKCSKCGRAIMWCRRGDADELGSPIEPHPKVDGNLMIVGFTLSLRMGVVVPHICAIDNIDELPDLTELPAWTERKRWVHHAPFCKLLVRTDDMPSRNIDDDPELVSAFHKRREQASRQRLINAFLQRVALKMPTWIPSKELNNAFTQYELGRANSHHLKAAMTYEPGLIGDFIAAQTADRNPRHHRRPLR